MSNSESKIQINIKTGPGFDASLINIYADSRAEADGLLADVIEMIPMILVAEQQAQAGGRVAAVLALAPQQPAQPSAAPPAVISGGYGAPAGGYPSPPTGPSGAGPEVVADRYGNRWTYGLGDAPLLVDGRGAYARKDWTSAKGAALKAWVDPAKGPKPFPPGAAGEAEIVWIR